MAHLVIWSRRAADDLAAVAEYIAQDSEVYASAVVRNILRKAQVLDEFPLIGRVVPEFFDESIREIFAYSYRIIYKVTSESVEIAAVVHAKRELNLAIKP